MTNIFQQNAELDSRLSNMSPNYEFAYLVPNSEKIQITGIGYYFSTQEDVLDFKPVDDNLYSPETAKIKASVLYSYVKSQEQELFKSGKVQIQQGLFYRVINHYFNDDMSRFLTDKYVVETGISNSLGGLQYSNIRFPRTVRKERFSIEWVGFFVPDVDGAWNFSITSDDAAYMWIGENAVNEYNSKNASINSGNVNNAGLHGPVTKKNSFNCIAGKWYPIRIQYGQNMGGLTFQMNINPPSNSYSLANPFTRFYSVTTYKNTNSFGSFRRFGISRLIPYEFKNVYFCLKEYSPEATAKNLFQLFILDPYDQPTLNKLKSRNVQTIEGLTNQLKEYVVWSAFDRVTESSLIDSKNVAFINRQGNFSVYKNGRPVKVVGDLGLQSLKVCAVRLDSTSDGVDINIYSENTSGQQGFTTMEHSKERIIEGMSDGSQLSTIGSGTQGGPAATTQAGAVFSYPDNPQCAKNLTDDEARCYADNNPDLKDLYGYDTNQLNIHWKSIGCRQYRNYSCDPKCTIQLSDQQASCYMNRYPQEFVGYEGDINYAKVHWKTDGCKKDYMFNCPWTAENQDSPTTTLYNGTDYVEPQQRPLFPANLVKVKTIASIKVNGAVGYYKYAFQNLKTFLPTLDVNANTGTSTTQPSGQSKSYNSFIMTSPTLIETSCWDARLIALNNSSRMGGGYAGGQTGVYANVFRLTSSTVTATQKDWLLAIHNDNFTKMIHIRIEITNNNAYASAIAGGYINGYASMNEGAINAAWNARNVMGVATSGSQGGYGCAGLGYTLLDTIPENNVVVTGNDFTDEVMGIDPYNAIRSSDFKYKMTFDNTGNLILLCAKEMKPYSVKDEKGNTMYYTKSDMDGKPYYNSEAFYFYKINDVNVQVGFLNYLNHQRRTYTLIPDDANILTYENTYNNIGNYAPYKQTASELSQKPVSSLDDCKKICNEDGNCSMLYYYQMNSQNFCKIVNDKSGFRNKYNSIQPSSQINKSTLYLRDSTLNLSKENMPYTVPLKYYFDEYPQTEYYRNVPYSNIVNRPIGPADTPEYRTLDYNTCIMLYGKDSPNCKPEGFTDIRSYKNVVEGMTYDSTDCAADNIGCLRNLSQKKINPLDLQLRSFSDNLNLTNSKYTDISSMVLDISNIYSSLDANAKYRFNPNDEIYNLNNPELKTLQTTAQNDSVEMMLQQNNLNIIGFIATTSILITSIMLAME